MSENSPLMLAVAPNGARKMPEDHPALPLTPLQLADTAVACLEAGACMIHLHVRDEERGHTLDPERYREATSAIRRAVGDDLIIQITSEAVGKYLPEQQVHAIKRTRPEAVSVALREICPGTDDELAACNFFEWMYRERVNPQYILYDETDIARFNELQHRGAIPGDVLTILLVLGRYSEGQRSDPEDLPPLAAQVLPQNVWWLCAFGASEAACMLQATARGGHCRVGFENNMLLPDGELAPDNATLVRTVATAAAQHDHVIADADRARQIMGYRN